MASEVCGADHPRRHDIECQKPVNHDGPHYDYWSGMSWSESRG